MPNVLSPRDLVFRPYFMDKNSMYSPGKKSTTYSSFLGGPYAIFLGERMLNFSFHSDISRFVQFDFSEKHREISPRPQVLTGENG